MKKNFRKFSMAHVVLLVIAAIVSLRNLPLFAEMGFSIFFFLIIAMICFFIPISLAIAELSSTWPSSSGCYLWIKKAYGKPFAFVVMWAYWMEGIVWFPIILIFIMVMLGYTLSPIYPNLKDSFLFLTCGIVVIFWILTYLNFFGLKFSAFFSIFGVFFGTVLPMFLIIFFGLLWVIRGGNINIVFNLNSFFPNFNFNNLVFFSGVLLGISGIEMIAFYINDIENPKASIAKSIIISSFLILFLYTAGSLSIAIVIPKSDISFASGIIQALDFFFNKINISFCTPIISFLLFLGFLASVNTWIIGPTKGLFFAVKDGYLPSFLRYVNPKKAPVNLLIMQAIVVTFLTIIFFMHINSINGLIWVFVCLSFQFASFLYIMIFFSVMKLRRMYPNIHRPYRMPCVKILSYIGVIMCIFTFFLSFIQPIDMNIASKNFYFILLLFSFIILMFPSIFFVWIRSKK